MDDGFGVVRDITVDYNSFHVVYAMLSRLTRDWQQSVLQLMNGSSITGARERRKSEEGFWLL